jgi:DNA-binding NarL/FixJ family response regulator
MIPLFKSGAQVTPAVEALAAHVMLSFAKMEGHTGTVFVLNRDQQSDEAMAIRRRRAAITAMSDRGVPIAVIAEKMGVHRKTVTSDLCTRRGGA